MHSTFDFLSNGGEMGALMRKHDWRACSLGLAGTWPEILKTSLRMMLTSHHPMFIWWGPDLLQFYNDAYRQTVGPERHPAALGQSGRVCWAEIWDIIGSEIGSIMAGGQSTWHEEELVPITRHGRREDVWWTYGYSPIQDSDGVHGVLVVCNDVTAQHLARQNLLALNRQLEAEVRKRHAVEMHQAFQLRLADALRDIPDPNEIAATAFTLLGGYMALTHIDYVTVDPRGTYRVAHAWREDNSVAQAGHTGDLKDFGKEISALLRRGQNVQVDNPATDIRIVALQGRPLPLAGAAPSGLFNRDDTCAGPAAAAAASAAFIVTPIIRDGSLVAMMHAKHAAPHDWDIRQVALVEHIGHQMWNAIEHARAEAKRLESERACIAQRHAESERLHRLFQCAPGFMVVFKGPHHIFEFCNAAYVSLMGERPFIGKTVREALPDIAGQGYYELLDQVYSTGTAFSASDVSLLIRRAPDQPPVQCYVDFVYQPIMEEDGTVSGIFVEGFDATDRRRVKTALQASEERLKEGMAALREADRRKDEFLAMLAHELRNPLAPISAAAHLLRTVDLDEKRLRRTSEIIGRQVVHMTCLINDLLDVSRVTTGRVEIEKMPLDIKQIVAESIEQVRPFIEASRHHFKWRASSVPMIVAGDHKRLVQIVTNVLQNAAKYTPDGGLVSLNVEIRNDEVVIAVMDNGNGIDASLLPHIFEPFTQEKRSSDRSEGGLGLGLALVKSLIQLHGGRVDASSAGVGLGTVFRLFLPQYHGPHEYNGSQVTRQLEQLPQRRLRLLLVDDNVDAAGMLAQVLEAAGHDVFIEHDSVSALERAASDMPDVFLLDIGLAGMDGNTLARRLKTMPRERPATFIAVTGYGQQVDRQAAANAGFDHYFVKPADTVSLIKLLSAITY